MDNSVYTFEQLFNQSLESQGQDDICKTIQRCQDRVLKVKQHSRVAAFFQKKKNKHNSIQKCHE